MVRSSIEYRLNWTDSCLVVPRLGLQRLGLGINEAAVNSVTRGLVGDTSFAVLPDITPRMTFLLTIFFQMVSWLNHFPSSQMLTRLDRSDKAIRSAQLGSVHRCGHALRLRILPVWLACA